MNKFKPGDDVWFFVFPEDGCGGFDVDQVELRVKRNAPYHFLKQGLIGFCFKTREEAVNAMIKQISTFKEV